eukprot:2163992-Prymnesium_polylepis.2
MRARVPTWAPPLICAGAVRSGDAHGCVAAASVELAALRERCACVRIRVAANKEWWVDLRVVVHDGGTARVWRDTHVRTAHV